MLERVDRDSDYPPGYDDFDEPRRGGFLRSVAPLLWRRPIRTAAAIVLTVGPALIVANAVFFQTARHPSPLFATRPESAAIEAAGIPVPRSRAEIDPPRMVQVTAVEQHARADVQPSSATLVEVQEGLAAAGYYHGAIDGLVGSRTRAAIEAFQRDHRMTVTGEVSSELVTRLRAATGGDVSRDVTAAIDPAASARVKAVQTALNQIGYGPVEVNGRPDDRTADAIRRFQLDNGLAITGAPDDTLVGKMVAIGAMQPI